MMCKRVYWWAGYVQPGTSVSDGAETWQRIGYTLENTTAADAAGSDYSTGVVFKAKFFNEKDFKSLIKMYENMLGDYEDLIKK